jgi:hypothetical protein
VSKQEKWEVALDYLGGDHRRVIVNLGDVAGGFAENMKRARLIAAAPTMLGALQEVVRELNGRVHSPLAVGALSSARAAIAAATGEK